MVAVAVFKGRVAPVLDWCTQIFLIGDFGEGDFAGTVLDVGDWSPYERLERIKAENAIVLICGAISRELLLYAEGLGLHVLHGVAGNVDEVLRAYRSGRLDQPDFWLPGCGGPRRYRSCRSFLGKEGEKIMAPGKGKGFGSSGGGGGRGQGRGQGQGGRGRCRAGGGQGAGMGRGAQGVSAMCACPACGEKVPHRPGVPCVEMTCPKCGKAMVRGDAI